MHTFAYFALLASTASAVSIPSLGLEFDDTVLKPRKGGCPSVQIVALGGEGTTVGDLGYLDTTIAAIQAAIPDTELFQIGYPAGSDSPTAIQYGVPQFRDHMNSYTSQCPDTKIVSVGYSAGGAAVMDVYCGDVHTGEGALDPNLRHNVLANIIYGDPTFRTGTRYAVGTCTKDGEVPRVYPGDCYPFGRKTKSYCSTDDQVCCSGHDEAVHFTYPAEYDDDAAHWVKAKYTYWKNNS